MTSLVSARNCIATGDYAGAVPHLRAALAECRARSGEPAATRHRAALLIISARAALELRDYRGASAALSELGDLIAKGDV